MARGIDWSGVARSINNLKGLNDPSYYEEARYDAAIEKKATDEANKLEAAQDKFEDLKTIYDDNQEKLNTAWENVGKVEGRLLLNRKPENESNPINITKIITDNDHSNLEHLNNLATDISGAVYRDIEALKETNHILNNTRIGEQLFKRERNIGGYYLDDDGKKVTNWDVDDIGGVSELELEAALKGTMKLWEQENKELGIEWDPRGIEEGFWNKFNATTRMKSELDIIEDVGRMVDSGNTVKNDEIEAYLASRGKMYGKKFDDINDKKLYFDTNLSNDMDYWHSTKAQMRDYDDEYGTGPKNGLPNEHWVENPIQSGMDIDKWVPTDIRKAMNKKNNEILDTANAWGYTHYLYDIDDANFDEEMLVFTKGEELPDGRVPEDVEAVSFADIGFTKDFYERFRKEQRVPVWQDLKMGGDFDGDGEIDDISKAADIKAHTAWFEGAEGQKWAFKLKKEFEWSMQFIEDMWDGKSTISKENANRFNEFIEIMWSAYPEHFEGKKRPHVEIQHAKGETDPILGGKGKRVKGWTSEVEGSGLADFHRKQIQIYEDSPDHPSWEFGDDDKFIKSKQYYYFTVN